MASLPRWGVRVHDYGGGLAEASYSYTQDSKRERPFRQPKGHSVNREVNEERAVRRAKANVRRKIMAAGLDHLLTLTYRENVEDLETAERDFRRFVREVRRRLGRSWHYVAVWERQERGAIHWHMAVKGFQPVPLLREIWREIVGERGGNIDVQYRRAMPRQKIARYLTKYLTKQKREGTSLGRHRYRCSLGIVIPTVVRRFQSASEAWCWICSLFTPFYHYQADDGSFGWVCSW